MDQEQTQARLRELANEAAAIFDRADAEGRELTKEERSEAEHRMARAKDLQAKLQITDVAGRIGGGSNSGDSTSIPQGDPGAVFVKSEGFRKIQDPGTRGQQWTTGPVTVPNWSTKAGTLLESGQGAGLVPVPQVVPGVAETLFEPLTVADLFGSQQVNAPTVRYAVEGTATSGAAGVAEGAAKPASDIALSTVDEPVKKIATSIIVSDELLEDARDAQSFVNGRLSLFVKLEEERQLLRGSGTNELVGLVSRSGVNTYAKAAGDDNVVALGRAIANTAGSSHVMPDAVIMHPANWLASRMLRDGTGGTVGQFYGGGPFTGAYGTRGATDLFGASLWGLPVALSTHVGAGTAIVGSFRTSAAIYRRSGVVVEATNSHASLFLTDQVAIRAEERLGLGCYHGNAFTVVSALTS